MDQFYSYVKEENDDDSLQYSFTTAYFLIYTVKFDAYQYQDYLKDYPNLLQNGYGFGFFKLDVIPHIRKPQDEKIWPTIHKILMDFIEENGDDVVLLYHCDSKDGKHAYREKLFNKWEQKIDADNSLYRKCEKFQTGEDEENSSHYKYMGAIASKANPHIDVINDEFERFGVALAIENK